MSFTPRHALAILAILALLGGPLFQAAPAQAGEAVQLAASDDDYDRRYKHSGGGGMILDFIVVRPLSFVVTVVGGAFFVATVPFSAIGGNVGEAFDRLVADPAEFTFTRCLGCWPRGV